MPGGLRSGLSGTVNLATTLPRIIRTEGNGRKGSFCLGGCVPAPSDRQSRHDLTKDNQNGRKRKEGGLFAWGVALRPLRTVNLATTLPRIIRTEGNGRKGSFCLGGCAPASSDRQSRHDLTKDNQNGRKRKEGVFLPGGLRSGQSSAHRLVLFLR